ncbi:retrovirus-related pol polyprotein from transposon TNT 1-94 [Tanacetum coccineum]
MDEEAAPGLPDSRSRVFVLYTEDDEVGCDVERGMLYGMGVEKEERQKKVFDALKLNSSFATILGAGNIDGVFVAQAAGNEGLMPKSIMSYSPWIRFVAVAIDVRRYRHNLTLENGKNVKVFPGHIFNNSSNMKCTGDFGKLWRCSCKDREGSRYVGIQVLEARGDMLQLQRRRNVVGSVKNPRKDLGLSVLQSKALLMGAKEKGDVYHHEGMRMTQTWMIGPMLLSLSMANLSSIVQPPIVNVILAKRAQPVLYDADTLLLPIHHLLVYGIVKEVLVHHVVCMKKHERKNLGYVSTKNGLLLYDRPKCPYVRFHQKDLFWRFSALLLSARKLLVKASKSATPATPFVRKSRPPRQVLASLRKVNAVFPQLEDTSSASNAIFEINKLRQQLQGKDDTIRNLDAQINIMKGVECTVPRDSGILSVLTTGTFRHPITVKVCVTDSWGDHYHLSVINVEGLKHTLFSVGTVCDGGFRSAFRQDFMSHPNYDMVDLLIGSRSMVMASVRLNHLNFGNIKRIWLGKSSKRITYAGNMTKDICVILSASLLIDCLNATVRFVRTDNGTEFVNKTLDGWFESVAVATACYTLNRSLVHTLHEKTYYELLKGKKPNLQYFRVFGSLCYPTNDYDDVGSPSTTVISEGAPAVTESLLPHQVPLPDTSDSDIETMFDHVDRKSFAPVARFEAIDLFHCPRSEHDMVFPVWSENASLTAELNEVVYVVQPEDCRSRASIEVVTDQERSLWDSKSSRAWFMTSYQAILIQIRIYKRQWSILLLYEKNRQTSFLLDVDTQRSTSGSLQFLGHRLVSWVIQKEKCMPSPLRKLNT